MPIVYELDPHLDTDEFIDILVRSSLAHRRPVDQPAVIQAALAHSDIVVTARVSNKLVGVSRAISDFSYCTYLSDLAVDHAMQRQGIGRELIRQTHQAGGLHTHLILIAAPNAETYYPHIGMQRRESCWVIPRQPAEPAS
jgi:predicted N-acetyltransferase YhbS